MSYRDRLQERLDETGRPSRVGLVGAGQMGRGFAAQLLRMPGIALSAVLDVDRTRAVDALGQAGITPSTATDLDAASRRSRTARAWRSTASASSADYRWTSSSRPPAYPTSARGLRSSRWLPVWASRLSTSSPTSRSVASSPTSPTSRMPSTRSAAATSRSRPRSSSTTRATCTSRSSAQARARTTRWTRTRLPSRSPVVRTKGHEPEDADQLRRRLQGDDRDGGASQHHRARSQQARDARPRLHRPNAAPDLRARRGRRRARARRRRRLLHRPGGTRGVRRSPHQRPLHPPRDVLPADG